MGMGTVEVTGGLPVRTTPRAEFGECAVQSCGSAMSKFKLSRRRTHS